MDLNKEIEYLVEIGFDKPTPIQTKCFQDYSNFNEVILYSKTGSGKTFAFLIPLIELLKKTNASGIQAIILAPTRELALQLEQNFKMLNSRTTVTTCYGGHSIKTEVRNLSANPNVVIGTPGRISDHIRRGNISLSETNYLIIDEFDKCLEIGFLPEIEHIYKTIKVLKKCFYCSATKLSEFPHFIQLTNPVFIDYLADVKPLDIKYYRLSTSQNKLLQLLHLVVQTNLESTIVFCNFREDVDDLQVYFEDAEIATTPFHGGMEQDERERSLIKFKNGSCPVLICTDLGSRGIDISQIKHIIHFQLPDKEDAFIHRNGRTARMNEDGSVYIFEVDLQGVSYSIPSLKPFVLSEQSNYFPPEWTTVYFSAGKKNKINKVDLLGFICQKGELDKKNVGMISVLDYSSYVALPTKRLPDLIYRLRDFKIKGQKVRIAISK